MTTAQAPPWPAEIEADPLQVAWLDYRGALHVRDCGDCPARDVLCDYCVVPDILSAELTKKGKRAAAS